MKPLNARMQRQLEAMTPEDRAKALAALDRANTPESRARAVAARATLDREYRETGTIAGKSRDEDKPQSEAIRQAIGHLRAIMDESAVSLTELGRRTGFDLPALSRIMSGQNANPSVPTLEKIADALGYRVSIELEPAAR